MYAYFSKGMTVGHVLTRRVLREITSIPGIICDLILAMFWIPDYSSYWAEDSAYIMYADGTRHTGVMRAIFGWIGEALGFAVGAPVGAIVGTALFFPDLLFRGFLFLNDKIYEYLNDFALFIGKTTFFEHLHVYDEPKSYIQKAWNLGTATIGMVLTAVPYAIAKTLEFFLPFLNISHPIAEVCSAAGGLLGWSLSILLYPPIYCLEKLVDLINLGRDSLFKAVALVYAKSGETPLGPDDAYDACIPYQAVHSDEFREQVVVYSSSSWAQLIFGPLKGQVKVQPSAPPMETYNPNELNDPITLEPLGTNRVPTVIDPHGHTFNDDKDTGTKGIRFWIQTKHECPLDHRPLREEDLIPNRAFNELRTTTQTGIYPSLV